MKKRRKPIRGFPRMSPHQLRQQLHWLRGSVREERWKRQLMETDWNETLALLDQALHAKAQMEQVMAARNICLPSYVVDISLDDAIETSLL